MRVILSLLLVLPLVLFSQINYPANMYGDSAHAPFYHGVASGDPLPNAVIIWTRITPSTPTSNITVHYEVATNQNFSNIIQSNSVTTNQNQDYTVKIDVQNLQPNTFYYYRFKNDIGQYSVIGRTKTAPQNNVNALNFAVASCSSIYGGFFNAYARIAEKDLNAVIHLGDYIYDFVDNNARFRIPQPEPTNLGVNSSVNAWRDRHDYYLNDPDLRLARQMHPWIMIWDNHDTDNGPNGKQAYLEWNPIRVPNSQHDTLYRSFTFGNLAQLNMVDMRSWQNIDVLPNGEPSIITNQQRNWLLNQLSTSTAQWNLITSQEMFGDFTIGDWGSLIGINGTVFDGGGWEGYNGERDFILNYIKQNNIKNPFFISGDAHISMVMDLHPTPFDSLSYNGTTGQGAYATEFLPTSITRVNLDERIGQDLNDAVAAVTQDINPHHIYSEFNQHGYGLINITPNQINAQILYSIKDSLTNQETLGFDGVVKSGDNHWFRTANSISKLTATNNITIRPNPAKNYINITLTDAERYNLNIINSLGEIVPSQQFTLNNNNKQVAIKNLPSGVYFVIMQYKNKLLTKRFVIN